ncbi:hypothetical protein [Microbulbifer hydrolyticus]|uniref:Uncharacterized protein n=1 Tax=Microbulbifer hydrolyticus TaxID=48074 RepID=A0A6P1TF03_9GAMM|nr:hypothetical protein [Microbulbifer hydrolyticus]MBB5212602.1 hypothetical protein [Microbulbifer hydrolyticus]QHQ40215.1 hypothetical protein GTQ55_15325 [Microbulbifer hydrolyticus]
MSTPQPASQASPQDFPLIAGQRAGKPIRCTPELQPVYDRLQQAANRNHHWARIAVKELNALTTGVLGKSNVYVRPGERQRGSGSEKYYVFLPGLKATVLRWMNDQFCITELVMDDNYFEAKGSAKERSKLGLYRVRKRRDRWETKYVQDGKVHKQKGRLVTIADSGYESATDAASYSIPGALEFFGKNTAGILEGGADLHFTPGFKPIGGLRSYSALMIDHSRASALHLAASMESAREVKNVAWVTDFGGSAVLTQAMQILVDKGVTLEGHTAYLHRPRTSPGDALKLAHKLNLSLNESFANTGFSPRGILSQFSVAGDRLNNEDDPYNRGHHALAWFKGVVGISTPVGVTAAVLTSPTAAMLGGIATAIGGAGAIYALGQSVAQDLRRRYKL